MESHNDGDTAKPANMSALAPVEPIKEPNKTTEIFSEKVDKDENEDKSKEDFQSDTIEVSDEINEVRDEIIAGGSDVELVQKELEENELKEDELLEDDLKEDDHKEDEHKEDELKECNSSILVEQSKEL